MSITKASGNAGIGGALITASSFGVPYGSTVADANGNYSIALTQGAQVSTLTPSLANYVFSPSSIAVDITTDASAGKNFEATLAAGQGWSPQDSRDATAGDYPNSTINDGQGSQHYTVPAIDSRVSGPPVDSRVNVPKDSRASKPQNSRVAPPFGEAGEP